MNFEPPFKRPSTTKRSRKSEQRAAEIDGGRRVPMSGAGRQKGDVVSERFKGEDKITAKESFTIKLSTLVKIEQEALHSVPRRIPYLRLTIKGQTWRMIRETDWKEVVGD